MMALQSLEQRERWRARGPAGSPLAITALILVALGSALGGCNLNLSPGRPDPVPAVDGMTPARVLDVVDGDTIRVSIDGRRYTVRYIGIDTPETVRPDHPVEWMGPEATAANEALVAGKTVYLEKDVSETDRYGRLLRYVYLADGTMVNLELVRQGYAHAGSYPPDVKHQSRLNRAEREAREAGRGPLHQTQDGVWGRHLSRRTVSEGEGTPGPATRTPRPSPSPEPQATGAGGRSRGIVIGTIHYRGEIKPNEPDEYCEIRNDGLEAVDLAGWRLNAGSDGNVLSNAKGNVLSNAKGQDMTFPSFLIQPGQVCRVYTNEVHPETCGFSFHSPGALWNNGGDCARLYDAGGALVAQSCY